MQRRADGTDTQSEVLGLDHASDAKQTKADRIEDGYLLLDPADHRMKIEDTDSGHGGHDEVAPVVESRGRHRSHEDIAQDPATETGDYRQHRHAETVELLTHADKGTGHRENGDSGKIHDQQEDIGHR